MVLKEFLKHSKESGGVLRQESKQAGRQGSKQAGKQASKQVIKYLGGIQSEPCPGGACLLLITNYISTNERTNSYSKTKV